MQQLLSFQSPLYSASIENPSREQARELLLQARFACHKLSFDYAPIKKTEIEELASQAGKISSISALARFVSSLKPSQLEEKLSSLVESPNKKISGEDSAVPERRKKEKGTPAEFAFSYYLSCLLSEMFPYPRFDQETHSAAKQVRLVANFGGWTAVRKVSLEKAEKKEVVACCATIFDSVRKKLPEYLCAPAKASEFNSLLEAFLSKFPQRKSFARIPEILSAAEKEEQKISSLAEKGSEKHLLDLFYSRCLEQAGYPPFVSIDQVSRIYPELKIPKPRGRIAGAGKKRE